MITRRQFAASSPLLAASALALPGCSQEPASDGHDAVAERTWRPGAATDLRGAALGRELVRCATENLIQAALDTRFDAASNAVRVLLEPTRAQTTPFFTAIPLRQCTRGDYDGRPLSSEELALPQRAGRSDAVRLLRRPVEAALV